MRHGIVDQLHVARFGGEIWILVGCSREREPRAGVGMDAGQARVIATELVELAEAAEAAEDRAKRPVET